MELSVEESPRAASEAGSTPLSVPLPSIRGEGDSPREVSSPSPALAAMELQLQQAQAKVAELERMTRVGVAWAPQPSGFMIPPAP